MSNEQAIKATLKSIFEYIGGIDAKYVYYAEVQTDLERLIKACIPELDILRKRVKELEKERSRGC